jgi:hypothetical protein
MGRYSTGATYTIACRRITIVFLKEQNYLQPGWQKSGTINFSQNGEPAGSISISTNMVEEPYLRLTYNKTDRYTNEKINIDYQVKLVRVPSNLGRGFRYYFVCPFSFKRCETLYMAYGSPYFKHREAYRTRLYYFCQLDSHRERCYRYHSIGAILDKLYEKQVKSHYRGNKTRLIKRIEALERRYNRYDAMASASLIELGIMRGLIENSVLELLLGTQS